MTKTISIIIIIIIIFFIFSPFGKKENGSEPEKNQYYYPNPECFDEASKKVYLDLLKISDYDELMDRLDNIVCDDNSPVIRFEHSNSEFNLIPSHKCPKDLMICCYKERNRLKITSDSIYSLLNSFPLDSLSSIVKKHIQNYGNDFGYSSSPRSAFFEIEKDSLISIKKMREVLIELSESFNEVNKSHDDSLLLSIRIGVEKFVEVRPPPPPPPKPIHYAPKK